MTTKTLRAITSRWKCPKCGSTVVQVSYPTWYREYRDYETTLIEIDQEAEILWWYCETCDSSDAGRPDENA